MGVMRNNRTRSRSLPLPGKPSPAQLPRVPLTQHLVLSACGSGPQPQETSKSKESLQNLSLRGSLVEPQSEIKPHLSAPVMLINLVCETGWNSDVNVRKGRS